MFFYAHALGDHQQNSKTFSIGLVARSLWWYAYGLPHYLTYGFTVITVLTVVTVKYSLL